MKPLILTIFSAIRTSISSPALANVPTQTHHAPTTAGPTMAYLALTRWRTMTLLEYLNRRHLNPHPSHYVISGKNLLSIPRQTANISS